MELVKKLAEIQRSLKAPKDKVNQYSPSKFKYRNCEAILIALKPLLDGEILLLNDEIVQIGDRFYVKATVTLKDSKDEISVSAFARECITKKGMDDAQLTGSCSSYARKYALCGLFAIDDSADDPDSRDNSGNVGFVLDDNAKSWIDAAKTDINNLNQITDANYKQFIKDNL